MRFSIPAIFVSLLIVAGCQQEQPKQATDSAALDVQAQPTPVAYTPPPMQTSTPDPALSSPSPVAPVGAATSGNNYTIQKGDTLWKIASQHYGDGKKWHEIADANPGLSPSALRVGATITLP